MCKKHKAPPPLETMPEEQVEARPGKYGLDWASIVYIHQKLNGTLPTDPLVSY